MTSALQWAIWGLVMTASMALIARAWKKQRAEWKGEHLRHPKVIAIIGLVCGVPFLGAAVASSFAVSAKEWWVPLVFVAFAGLGGWLFYEYLRVRIELNAGGFAYRTALSEGTARWSEVRAIAWSPSMSWFVLTLDGDRTLRVSVLLLGLDRFAKALLESSGAATMSAETRSVLNQTAAGNPPSPWG
jgi:hypothetical protein